MEAPALRGVHWTVSMAYWLFQIINTVDPSTSVISNVIYLRNSACLQSRRSDGAFRNNLAGVRWENCLLYLAHSGWSIAFGSENRSPQPYYFFLAR
jgi:hypothetical protein